MAGEEDVVVAERGGEQVGGETGGLNMDLRATEPVFVLIGSQLNVLCHKLIQLSTDLEEGEPSGTELAVNGNPNPGLKMGVVAVILDDIEGHGAVRKEQVVARNLGQIDLETGCTGHFLRHGHRQHGRNIALAGRNNPITVQKCQSETTGSADCGQQVETAQRQAVKMVFIYDYT